MKNILLASVCAVLAFASNLRAAEPKPDTAPLEVTIDATKPGAPINPFIYGQFIEHLGRCIYGGIWAEMLEDRKFYFPITEEYRPYRALTETKFPVVGASPWEIVGEPSGVVMIKNDPMLEQQGFATEHSVRISGGGGIRQNDLSLVAGKEYVGYVWVKSSEGPTKIIVQLGTAAGEASLRHGPIAPSDMDYVQIPFKFEFSKSTDKGRLTIAVEGAPCMIGAVSLMPADNVRGMRADTLALLKQLNATVYRWPGGNFVSGYNWRDGIGPRDRRPPRRNPAWTGVEHNDFGVDEFIDFCREVNAEPMIAVNTGFGDDYSAAQEVEYVNGSAETIGGSWRVKNGHAKPYGVKYWCVGNEMFGNWQLGFMQLAHYTQKHNLVAKAMWNADPSLVLVGVGDYKPNDTVNWSEGMLRDCHRNMNMISEHFYRGRVPWGEKPAESVPEHVGKLKEEILKKSNGHRELQKKLNLEKQMPIAMDEWNYWHQPYVYGELGCVYDLKDALGIAAGLHEYFRNSDIVHMAHYAQTVNVIGCVKTTKTAAFFDATALPLVLYRREFGRVPLAVAGDHEKSSVDVAAARTEDGSAVTIGIVNPHAKPQTIQFATSGLKLADKATVWRIAGDDPAAFNTDTQQPVAIAEERGAAFGNNISVPGYSVNVYRVAIQ
jgi:alpha-L-arabinofuranosidase